MTGVQTCALPIWDNVRDLDYDIEHNDVSKGDTSRCAVVQVRVGYTPTPVSEAIPTTDLYISSLRSEERRVGKECRTRWSPDH